MHITASTLALCSLSDQTPPIDRLFAEAKMQLTGWTESVEGHWFTWFIRTGSCCPPPISFLAAVTGKVGSSLWQHILSHHRTVFQCRCWETRLAALLVSQGQRGCTGSGAARSGTGRRENADSPCSFPAAQSTRR